MIIKKSVNMPMKSYDGNEGTDSEVDDDYDPNDEESWDGNSPTQNKNNNEDEDDESSLGGLDDEEEMSQLRRKAPKVEKILPKKREPEFTFRCTITDFAHKKETEEKVESETFSFQQFTWRLLLHPAGNPNNRPPAGFAFYLQCDDAEEEARRKKQGEQILSGEAVLAPFEAEIGIVNQHSTDELELNPRKQFSHLFTSDSPDWGFSSLATFAEIEETEGSLVDGDLVVCIHMWHCPSQLPYNSKKMTGYIGLDNQGATCYMNSLLQSLFHLQALRKAVYMMPTEDVETVLSKEHGNNIPLALQRVFFLLQTDSDRVFTKELTSAFGWDSLETFTQHDVQELLRLLVDNLEEKMKGTEVEGRMPELFKGVIQNYISCVHVDYQSTRKEDFYDLSLNVKGLDDIYEAFDKYTEVEMMDGDNKYQADGHGLQDARMGKRFLSFPPILMIHLKRFEYDFNMDRMVKVNDRFEFYDCVDLNSYIHHEKVEGDETAEPVDYTYSLHSMLIHGGDVHAGHYYAYIRPNGLEQWYKFDDEEVRECEGKVPFDTYKLKREREAKANSDQLQSPSAEEAIPEWLEDSFGGKKVLDKVNAEGNRMVRVKRSNAYMLVYMRDDCVNDMVGDLNEVDPPKHLFERLEADKKAELERRRQQQEAHKWMDVKVATLETIEEFQGMNLISWGQVTACKVLKDMLVDDWIVQQPWATALSPGQHWRVYLATSRSYPFSKSQESAPGMNAPRLNLLEDEEGVAFSSIQSQGQLPKLVILRGPHPSKGLEPIFFKTPTFYSAAEADFKTSLSWIHFAWPLAKLGEVVDSQTRPCVRCGENKMRWLRLGLDSGSVGQLPISTGGCEDGLEHLLPGQLVYLPKDDDDGDDNDANKIEEFLNAVVVTVYQYEKPSTQLEITLSKNMSYQEVCRRLAECEELSEIMDDEVSVEPTHILLYQHDWVCDRVEREPVVSNDYHRNWRLSDAVENRRSNNKKGLLYFRVIPVPVNDWLRSEEVVVEVQNSRGELISTPDKMLIIEKGTKVGEIPNWYKSHSRFEATADGAPLLRLDAPMRFFTVGQAMNRIKKANLAASATVDVLYQEKLILEEVPEVDQECGDVKLYDGVHIWENPKDNSLYEHGRPFVYPLDPQDTTEDVARRLQSRFEVSDEEFAEWHLVIYNTNSQSVVSVLDSSDIVDDKLASWGDKLALKHEGEQPMRKRRKVTSLHSTDRQMKIHG